MPRKIFRTGNSTVVSLPVNVLEKVGLGLGDEVIVAADPKHSHIVITSLNVISQIEQGERLAASPLDIISQVEPLAGNGQGIDAWEELCRLGDEIGRGWQSPLTSTELLSEMRR